MSRTLRTLLSLPAIALVAPLAVSGAGGASAPTQPDVAADPTALAANHYNRAIKGRDKAWELEEELAAATTDKERQKLEKKIGKQYKSALGAARQAVQLNPRMYQAQSTLGYLLRRTGDYEGSIEAYNRSLAVNPRYSEAIEYRAEAHLALGMLNEVKEAYMLLFQVDREKADELMAAMQLWVEDNSEGRTADQESFASWVEERAGVAEATVSLARPGSSWRGR